MEIGIYNQFMKEMDFEKSFNWNPKWSALKGLEKSTDYAAELTDLKKLKLYNPPVHLNGFFTGFVEVSDEGLYIDSEYTEANYLYIEKGGN